VARTSGATSAISEFGAVLRDWRNHRRLSQLALAGESGISQRHISFLETGRSQPSRATVLALADSLDIPLREHNVLLHSAGYSAAYSEQPLDGESSKVFRDALQATLDHHEPFPALVLDGRWSMVMANTSALRFFALFVDIFQALENIGAPKEFQLVRLCLADAGLRPFIVNWRDLVFTFLQRARRALLVNPRDPLLPALIEEIVKHRDAPGHWRNPERGLPPPPAINMIMERDGRRFSLFTMLAHFGAAQWVTLEELSVETFYPADELTKRQLLALAE